MAKSTSRESRFLPLVVNLTRPSPPIGWLNAECPSFLDRARGAFDCILMLAVIHHMLVTERVPLRAIINLAAELTTRHAIIEFIDPADSMFRRLLRGRDELHRDLNATVRERVRREIRYHPAATDRRIASLGLSPAKTVESSTSLQSRGSPSCGQS